MNTFLLIFLVILAWNEILTLHLYYKPFEHGIEAVF